MDSYVARHTFAALLWRIGSLLHDGASTLYALARQVDALLAERKRAAEDRALLDVMNATCLTSASAERAFARSSTASGNGTARISAGGDYRAQAFSVQFACTCTSDVLNTRAARSHSRGVRPDPAIAQYPVRTL